MQKRLKLKTGFNLKKKKKIWKNYVKMCIFNGEQKSKRLPKIKYLDSYAK